MAQLCDSAMVIVIDEEELENVPENLEDLFDKFPTIGEANLELTDREHVSMWRDQVLFIRQRQQATSDFRENPKVRWIGSILFTRSNKPILILLTNSNFNELLEQLLKVLSLCLFL